MATSLASPRAPAKSDQGDAATGLLVLGGLAAAGAAGYLLWKRGRAPAPRPGSSCPATPRTIIQNPAGYVWVVTDDCRRRNVHGWPAFDACRYDRARMVQVSDAVIAALPVGPNIDGPPDCPPAPQVAPPSYPVVRAGSAWLRRPGWARDHGCNAPVYADSGCVVGWVPCGQSVQTTGPLRYIPEAGGNQFPAGTGTLSPCLSSGSYPAYPIAGGNLGQIDVDVVG